MDRVVSREHPLWGRFNSRALQILSDAQLASGQTFALTWATLLLGNCAVRFCAHPPRGARADPARGRSRICGCKANEARAEQTRQGGSGVGSPPRLTLRFGHTALGRTHQLATGHHRVCPPHRWVGEPSLAHVGARGAEFAQAEAPNRRGLGGLPLVRQKAPLIREVAAQGPSASAGTSSRTEGHIAASRPSGASWCCKLRRRSDC